MQFITQIGLLFSNMAWPVIVCLIVGLIFFLIEVFQPGFGVFGIVGFLLLVVGVVLRAVFSQAEDNILAQIFIMLFIISIIIISAFIIMVKSSKMGWLSRSPFIEKATAVSTGISEGTKDYTKLRDKMGITTTDLRPTGKVRIDNEVVDAYAEGFYITKGESVKVVDTIGGIITVRRID